MTIRSLLLSSAVLFIPFAPALAQDQQPSTQGLQAQRGAATQGASAAQPQAQIQSRASLGRPGTAQPADEYGDEEEIVITGAKPRGSVVGDIPPENTLDARDVRATGASNINELLDALAPQIGSSQGRGGERPVLLLNGQRIASFRELRDIPTEAIQRVEILPEEVALKYGYGANQKVVNIVLRQRFRSTTAQLGAGIATDGGYVSGNGDLTRFLVQRNGRTTINLHADGNSLLTEADRDIRLNLDPQARGTTQEELAARSLIGRRRDVRGSATFNRQLSTSVSGTLNAEVEHTEGRSLIGLNESLVEPLARGNSTDTAHLGGTLNGQTKSQWRWTLTSNADLGQTVTHTERASSPNDRARATTASADLTGTANGTLFKLPAGNATTTLTLGGSTMHLDSSRTTLGSSTPLSRSTGTAGINLDVPISRRGRDFSALGNLTLNGNAEVNQLSDFGTMTTIGAGVNFSPLNRLNFIASWAREEAAPSINQLGDPVLETPGSRIFDFTTGRTVLVNAITGGNPNLRADRRTVTKLSANWQPFPNTDLRLRADYVHQTIDRPISNITVTRAIETAFPGRFVHDTVCDNDGTNCRIQLVSVNLTPINFDQSTRDQLRFGFDFTHPLKSRQPSQAVIQQMRAQFGFGPRGSQANGARGPAGSPPEPGGPSPEGAGALPGSGFGGGRSFGGGRGGSGGGFFGGAGGGGSRGRVTLSVTDTLTFVDKVRIAPGLPDLDYLHGDAAGASGGTPRHKIQVEAGYFNNGLGARIGANWRSATNVNTLTGDDVHFSPYGTFDLRLFANPGDIPEMVVKHPWLRGTQLRLDVTNMFNTRPQVHDAAGNVPLNYQPGLLEPLGRTVMLTFRKLFLPSPTWFRRQFQLERQRQ